MTAAILPHRAGVRLSAWRSALVVLAGGWAALLLLFHRDASDVVAIWWSSSTFAHCLFIGPIIAWLVWQRSALLARLVPRGWAPGLLLVAAGAGGWLLGQAAGVGLARHLGLMLMLQGMVVAVLGPAVARAIAFPLGYALFLVPAGDGLVAPLQTLTARMCMLLLDLSGIPARLDGVFISTSSGWFEVAEACSGAKFVIAMLAFGALAANLCFRSPWRRAAFMAAAVIVPILANGVRAFATILVEHLSDASIAGSFDHVVYGWFFFAAVIVLLLAVSWRFFDRSVDDPAFDPGVLEPVAPRDDPRRRLWMAGAALLIAALPAGWSAAIAARGGALAPAQIVWPAAAGWSRVASGDGVAWAPSFPGADRLAIAHYRDRAGQVVDIAIAAYGDQSDGREIVGFGIGPVGEHSAWGWASDDAPIAGGRTVRIVGPGDTGRDVAIFYRVGGVLTGSPTQVKLATLRQRLFGGRQSAVAVLVSAQAPRGGTARPAINALLAALPPVATLADGALR